MRFLHGKHEDEIDRNRFRVIAHDDEIDRCLEARDANGGTLDVLDIRMRNGDAADERVKPFY